MRLVKETVLIGDTLFVNGSPHKVCGHCGKIIGSDEYGRTLRSSGAVKSKGKIVKDGKVSYEVKPYMIKILIKFDRIGEEIVIENGFPTLKEKWIPKILNKPGCFECWYQQNTTWEFHNGVRRQMLYKLQDCQAPKLEGVKR